MSYLSQQRLPAMGSIVLGLCVINGNAHAQNVTVEQIEAAAKANNADSLLRQNSPPVQALPYQGKGSIDTIDDRRSTVMLTKGVKVAIKGFRFKGNHEISSEQLLNQLPEVYRSGNEFMADLDEINQIAKLLTEYYRAEGNYLARFLVERQVTADGYITLTVLEGKVGAIKTENDSQIPDGEILNYAYTNLCDTELAPKCQDVLVKHAPMDRSIAIISDLPGVVDAVVRLDPGAKVGTADLTYKVKGTRAWDANIGYDNFGGTNTGKDRLLMNGAVNNLFDRGDLTTLSYVGSGFAGDHFLNLLTLGHTEPIGYRGFKLGATMTLSNYKVGGEFADADINGDYFSMAPNFSYPIIRSQEQSVYLRGSYEFRQTSDRIGSLQRNTGKRTGAATLGISGIFIDDLMGYASTIFGLSANNLDVRCVRGECNMTGRRANKLNYNVARDQTLFQTESGRTSLFASIYGQYTRDRLPSDKFSLGGPEGVRGYPNGEASGDIGHVTSLELRHTIAFNESTYLVGSVFHDRGAIRYNFDPDPQAGDNTKILNSNGVSVTFAVRNQLSSNSQFKTIDRNVTLLTS